MSSEPSPTAPSWPVYKTRGVNSRKAGRGSHVVIPLPHFGLSTFIETHNLQKEWLRSPEQHSHRAGYLPQGTLGSLHMLVSWNDISRKVTCSFSLSFLEKCKKHRCPLSPWPLGKSSVAPKTIFEKEDLCPLTHVFLLWRRPKAGQYGSLQAVLSGWEELLEIMYESFLQDSWLVINLGTGLSTEYRAGKRKILSSQCGAVILNPCLCYCPSRLYEAEHTNCAP